MARSSKTKSKTQACCAGAKALAEECVAPKKRACGTKKPARKRSCCKG